MTNEELKKKVEPDGYCAYREDGTLIKGELQICVTTRRQAWNFKRAKDNNYIIKPVWLSDTPPVSKEVLEWIEEARKIYWQIGNKEHPEVYELEDAMLEIFEKLELILEEPEQPK